tara:strand:- start:8953 stop:9183 length:231 start_codon:yes stop_codon:yes gene_type:complete
MPTQKSQSIKKTPDGKYEVTIATKYIDQNTSQILRIEEYKPTCLYVECNSTEDYDYKIEYFDFDGVSQYLFLKSES